MRERESDVAKGVKVSFSILAQRGLGYFARTPVLSGMFLNWDQYKAGDVAAAHHVEAGKKGWPDYTGVVRRASDGAGIFVGVETKVASGEQRENQKEAQAIIELLGGAYVLARSREEFEEAVFPIAGLEPGRIRGESSDETVPVPF